MKTIAIMQPYFFPYRGYFELMQQADEFILLDTVNYMTRSFINRNTIELNKQPKYISLPIRQASQNRQINELAFSEKEYHAKKLIKQLQHAYHQAPNFDNTLEQVKNILAFPANDCVSFIEHSLQQLQITLGFSTPLLRVSNLDICTEQTGSDRIIEICKNRQATHYVNSIGGKFLYAPHDFATHKIELSFYQSPTLQNDSNHPPYSIIHDLMHAAQRCGRLI